MSDIKLYRVGEAGAQELAGTSVAIEKTLQTLIERHLEALLGVRFLASEHSTGKAHGGRIDTLGIDENAAPVIIEYKRSTNQNVINQGLFYLDWLLDHKADFKLMVQDRYGREQSDAIDWRYPRLLCIASDFTRYDEYAIQQINRNIELIRYRRYGDDLLLLELANTTSAAPLEEASTPSVPNGSGPVQSQRPIRTAQQVLDSSSPALRDTYEALRAFLLALGDDVQEKALNYYIGFRRIKNFACVQIHPQSGALIVFTKVDPRSITLEPGFTRDVTAIGHQAPGNLEFTIRTTADLERAQPMLVRSYEAS